MAIFFLYPIAIIWSLNQLFNLGIQYTFWNWVAVNVFTVFFNGRHFINITKD
jgi:hypothetical protein